MIATYLFFGRVLLNFLILNGGSSSVKFSIFAEVATGGELTLKLDGQLSGALSDQALLETVRQGQAKQERAVHGRLTAGKILDLILQAARESGSGHVSAVGYRVVHPGPEIDCHIRITEEVLDQLDAARDFAPLHDPEAVTMIREMMQRLPQVPHFACFDTIFHQTMPEEASTYAIPLQYRQRGVKRYGFHGLSCESVVRQMRQTGALPARMVIAHLGSGCSVTALLNGASVDTTMGLTPTGGVVMGTRPGDLDPGLLLYLLRQDRGDDAVSKLELMLNHQAGMVALTGLTNDMKEVRGAAARGDLKAGLALQVFTRSVRKAIGGFAWLLDGLDAIVFTGGIGEHDATTRTEVLPHHEVSIDSSLNAASGSGFRLISASHSRTAVFVVPAQEDLVIALHVQRLLQVPA